jgi:hypothetical protein
MGSPLGDRSLTLLAGALVLAACSHLTKYTVQEVPIESYQAPAPTPILGEDAGPAVPEVVATTGTTGTSASAGTHTSAAVAPAAPGGAAGAPGAAPVAIVPDDPDEPGDPKLQAATKLLKSGKHADLLAARKLLGASVFTGTGSADQARLLRLVCSKLGDKPCVARCAQYIK